MNKLQSFQDTLRSYIRAQDAHEGSHKAFQLEKAFICGAIAADPNLVTEIPLLTICPMSGRSILELELDLES